MDHRIICAEPYRDAEGNIGFCLAMDNPPETCAPIVCLDSDEWPGVFSKENNEDEWEMLNKLARDGEKIWPLLDGEPPVEEMKERFQTALKGVPGDKKEMAARKIRNEILSEIRVDLIAHVRKYMYLANEKDYEFMAAWTVMTYFKEQLDALPMICFDSETNTGKTTAEKTLRHVVYRGFLAENITPSSIADLVETYGLTILLDEASDAMRNKSYGDEYVGIIRASFNDEATYVRRPADLNGTEVKRIFTPLTYAIKNTGMPNDVVNRSVVINPGLKPSSMTLTRATKMKNDETAKSIRARLYALKILTVYYSKTRDVHATEWKGLCGCWIDDLKEETETLLTSIDTKSHIMRQLYTIEYDGYELPDVYIDNRNADIAMSLIPFAIAMDNARIIWEKIQERVVQIDEDKKQLPAAILTNALLDLIRGVDEYSDEGDRMWEEIFESATDKSDMWRMIKDSAFSITIKGLKARYDTIAATMGLGYEISPKKTGLVLRGLTFQTYEASGTHRSTLKVWDDSAFDKKLIDAIQTYANDENIKIFKRILNRALAESLNFCPQTPNKSFQFLEPLEPLIFRFWNL